MKRYISPTFYAVDVQTESIATWGSIEFDKGGTSTFDDTSNGMQIGGGSDYFDASSSRSSWQDYEN